MFFYGYNIPDRDLKKIKEEIKKHLKNKGGCPLGGCEVCVLHLKERCLPCDGSTIGKYENLKHLSPSTRRDNLFLELLNYKSIIQEEFEV